MTRSSAASVTCGAGIAVVAGVGVVGVHATCLGVAGVGRTDVAIVAVGRRPAYACSVGTRVVCRTRVPVVAGVGVVGVHATRLGVAGVGRAHVAVVAVGRRPTHACSVGTGVVGRTRVAVVARVGGVRGYAAGRRVVGGGGTAVAVSAVDCWPVTDG